MESSDMSIQQFMQTIQSMIDKSSNESSKPEMKSISTQTCDVTQEVAMTAKYRSTSTETDLSSAGNTKTLQMLLKWALSICSSHSLELHRSADPGDYGAISQFEGSNQGCLAPSNDTCDALVGNLDARQLSRSGSEVCMLYQDHCYEDSTPPPENQLEVSQWAIPCQEIIRASEETQPQVKRRAQSEAQTETSEEECLSSHLIVSNPQFQKCGYTINGQQKSCGRVVKSIAPAAVAGGVSVQACSDGGETEHFGIVIKEGERDIVMNAGILEKTECLDAAVQDVFPRVVDVYSKADHMSVYCTRREKSMEDEHEQESGQDMLDDFPECAVKVAENKHLNENSTPNSTASMTDSDLKVQGSHLDSTHLENECESNEDIFPPPKAVAAPFKCRHCGLKFKNRTCFVSHENIHEDSSNKCSYCGRRFTHVNNLKKHLLLHTNRELYESRYRTTFSCEHCDKKFRSRTALKLHLNIHTKEKPYECAICRKRFSQPGHARRHAVTHTNTKPYKCSLCPKAFTSRNSHSYHFLIHAGEWPYNCDNCDKRFRSSGGLKKHLQKTNHTGKTSKGAAAGNECTE